jgi:hypothetical protein
MTKIRSALSMSSGVTRRAWWSSKETEFSRATRKEWKDEGLPGKAVSPAEPISMPLEEFFSNNFLRKPAAKGLRQVLPVQTKRIFRILSGVMGPLEDPALDAVVFSLIHSDLERRVKFC